MSKYSFIDIGKSDLNKQCFCIDVNTSKVPFNYDLKDDNQSFLLNPHSPSDIDIKSNTPSNIDNNLLLSNTIEDENKNIYDYKNLSNININNNKDINSEFTNINNVIQNDETKTLIEKLKELENRNTILNNKLMAANDKSTFKSNNTPSDINLDNLSLKTNKMYHDVNSGFSIHENFSDKDKEMHKMSCSDICSINNTNKIFNENFYIFLIIVILLIFAYFTSRKSV